MAYQPTENDRVTAEDWLKAQDSEIEEGIFQMGYYPFEYGEALDFMNKYAAWNLREFCKELRNLIEEWEESDEHQNGIPISDIFESKIINQFK